MNVVTGCFILLAMFFLFSAGRAYHIYKQLSSLFVENAYIPNDSARPRCLFMISLCFILFAVLMLVSIVFVFYPDKHDLHRYTILFLFLILAYHTNYSLNMASDLAEYNLRKYEQRKAKNVD